MATPFVAAGAALVRAANPSFTKAQVDAALQGTALDDNSRNGRDDEYGWGLLQVDDAVFRAAAAPGGLRAFTTVKVKAIKSRGVIHVDVNPNKGRGYWRLQVEKRRADGSWARLSRTYKTSGSKETRSINMSKGTYRIVVRAKYGYLETTSRPVSLRK